MNEGDCRYLAALDGRYGPFFDFIKAIEFELPHGVKLTDAVRWGWIVPQLRIAIPARFLSSWENFPEFSRQGEVHPDDWWADHAWTITALNTLGQDHDDSTSWYAHPFDTTDPTAVEVRTHAIDAGPGHAEPELVEHPRRRGVKIIPWIDYFAYWQAYQLAETVRAAELFSPILNTPTSKGAVKNALSRFDDIKAWSESRIGIIQRRYDERRRVLDWLSRFRTLAGRAAPDRTRDEVRAAARHLCSSLGLTPEKIRDDIRDVLLVMWTEWWAFPRSRMPAAFRRNLQNDVARAVQFHNLVSDEQIDPYDDEWDPPDRMPREWTYLNEVLPYERDHARRGLAVHAPHYLKRFNAVADESRRFDETRVKDLTAKWWRHSSDFRRFCIAFHRLHQHYGGSVNADNDVGIVVQTPQEFLILCALHAEKFLSAQKQLAEPGSRAPELKPLLRYVADPVLRKVFKLGGPAASKSLRRIKEALDAKTSLHDLPVTKANPFLSFQAIDDELAFFETAIVNLGILRNYAAHHSCLDYELVRSDWTPDPIEAMLLVLLGAMEVFTPTKRD